MTTQTADRELTEHPTSVAFYPTQHRELAALKERTGLKRSELVRLAIDELYERTCVQTQKAG